MQPLGAVGVAGHWQVLSSEEQVPPTLTQSDRPQLKPAAKEHVPLAQVANCVPRVQSASVVHAPQTSEPGGLPVVVPPLLEVLAEFVVVPLEVVVLVVDVEVPVVLVELATVDAVPVVAPESVVEVVPEDVEATELRVVVVAFVEDAPLDPPALPVVPNDPVALDDPAMLLLPLPDDPPLQAANASAMLVTVNRRPHVRGMRPPRSPGHEPSLNEAQSPHSSPSPGWIDVARSRSSPSSNHRPSSVHSVDAHLQRREPGSRHGPSI